MILHPIILDLKGLVMNAYHTEMTHAPLVGNLKPEVNTAEKGFETFITKVFQPLLDAYESPIGIIAVLDDGATLRKTRYAGYKLKRSTKEKDKVEEAEIKKLLEWVGRFLAALGIPLVSLKGQEADDVIAYLAKNLKGLVTVYTNDNDLLALSSDTVSVFVAGKPKNEIIDEAGNVIPAHLTSLYKSIIGDKGDEYGGVKGMGPKAWTALVEAFGIDGMEELEVLIRDNKRLELKAIARDNIKALQKLAEGWDEWQLMYWLARLHPEICSSSVAQLKWYKRAPTIERLEDALGRASALWMIEDFKPYTYQKILVTMDNLEDALADFKFYLRLSPCVAWDYETTDKVQNQNLRAASGNKNYVDVLAQEITGCSFALGPNLNQVYYFSVDHKDTNNVPKETILEIIKLCELGDKIMVAQNVAFEATVTQVQLGHTLKEWDDTKAFYHHIDENTEHGLKFLSKHYLNYDQMSYAATLEAASASVMAELTGEQVLGYGCDDSLVTAHLYQLASYLTQLEGTYDFIREYECPAVGSLIWPYINGAKLDFEEMEKQSTRDRETVKTTMAEMRRLLEEHCLNPNLDAVEVLFEDQKDYAIYKACQKEGDKGKLISEALSVYRQKLKDNSRYIPPFEVRTPVAFSPTPAKLSLVAAALGLPPVEKTTKGYLTEYLSDHRAPGSKFLALLGPASAEFKAKEGSDYEALKAYCEEVLYDIAPVSIGGTEMNLGSPVQMQYLMYLLLGLPIRLRTKPQKDSLRRQAGLAGSPSCDDSAIDLALANDCGEGSEWKTEFLKLLQRHNSADTRISNYWNTYPLWADENHTIHPQFGCPGTVTRRPTGREPNLLQVSKEGVRDIFIPREEDNVIASIDFGSQELRTMAGVTKDANLLSAYMGPVDKDLHAMTACGIVPSVWYKYERVDFSQVILDGQLVDYSWFKEHQDDLTPIGKMLKDVRGISKTVNFGVSYGAVAQTVSQQAMIPLDIAEMAVNGFHLAYPGVNLWKEDVYAFAKQFGYVATTYGSRRHCGNALNSGSFQERGRWERQLTNFLIQGQCADLLKVVLANAFKTGLWGRFNAMLLAPIYDEVLVELPKSQLHDFLHAIADLMEVYMPGIEVPMVADCSFGKNWGKQIEVGIRPTVEKVNEALAKLEKSHEKTNDNAGDVGVHA